MPIVLVMDFMRALFNAVFTEEVDRFISKYIVPIVQTLAYLFKFKQ